VTNAPSFDLRHALATLAYRAEKVLRDVPDGFADFRPSPTSRTPLALVAHLGDLIEWGQRMALRGEMKWAPVAQPSWPVATDRFFQALTALDEALRLPESDAHHAAIFQGPIADALTHVGQLSLMRGMIGAAVRPESYARAHITPGRVGRDQDTVRTEYDGDASPQGR
jgi:hypothetical protein